MIKWTNSLVLLQACLFLSLLPAARADELAYATTPTQAFGVVDLNTGAFTQTGISSASLDGLGELNNVLYGVSSASQGGTSTLYRVSPANGSLTPVGDTSIDVSEFGSTTAGLFALSTHGIYSINPANGAASLIGSTGILLGTTAELSVGANELYFVLSGPSASRLYSINPATGSLASIGGSAPGVCLKAMAFEDGTLYDASGFCNPGSEIFAVNPANGSSTFVSSVTGFDDVNGLAPLLATPEPRPVFLDFLGLTALILIALRFTGLNRPHSESQLVRVLYKSALSSRTTAYGDGKQIDALISHLDTAAIE